MKAGGYLVLLNHPRPGDGRRPSQMPHFNLIKTFILIFQLSKIKCFINSNLKNNFKKSRIAHHQRFISFICFFCWTKAFNWFYAQEWMQFNNPTNIADTFLSFLNLNVNK